MKRQIALKVDIFGAQNYSMDTWLGNDSNDPTTALLSVDIDKERNSPDLTAVVTLLPDYHDGQTWADRISLFDTIIISCRIGTVDETVEHVMFIGFIADKNHSVSTQDSPHQEIVLICKSIGHFLTAPFLAFDKLTDGMAKVLGVDTSIWAQIQALNDQPQELMGRLMNILNNSFLVGVDFPYKNTQLGWGWVCGTRLYSVAEVLPFEFALQSMQGGFQQSFWTAFESIAELQRGVQWCHEVYLDIMSDAKLAEWDSIISSVGDTLGAVPASGYKFKTVSGINFSLNLLMRPNPFPLLNTSDPSKFYEQAGMLDSSTSLDKTFYDKLLNSTNFHHDLRGRNFSYQFRESVIDIRTVFMLYTLYTQPTNIWSYSLPTFYDTFMYPRGGYAPLSIYTNYVRARARLEGNLNALDKVNVVSSITKLLLRLTGYNILSDIYKSGMGVLDVSPEISVGEIITMQGLHQGQDVIHAYVEKVRHSFQIGKKSSTTVWFSRAMTQKTYDNLFDTMQSRIGFASTINFKEFLSKYKLPTNPVQAGVL